jgi:hypothetical protein
MIKSNVNMSPSMLSTTLGWCLGLPPMLPTTSMDDNLELGLVGEKHASELLI